MEINAHKMHHENYRPFSVLGAVAKALDGIEVGGSLQVDRVVDALGRERGVGVLRTSVNKTSNGRRFVVMTRGVDFAVIHRVS